jgi:hypothetical protein
LLEEADTATDGFAEAVFLTTLVEGPIDAHALVLLERLADLAQNAAHEYADCLHEGQELYCESARGDLERFFVGAEQLAGLAGAALDARRAATERLMRSPSDYHSLYLLMQTAGGLERAVAALARCGPIVRDYVLAMRARGR